MPETKPDEQTTETTTTGSETETASTDAEKLAALQAEVEKWKAMSRKNEDQAKANADKAKQFDELQEANKTEVEKLRERAETAEAKVASFESEKERATVLSEVAKAKGVPESALRGSTKEELESHADELIGLGIKTAAAATSDGQGDTGDQVSKDGEKSADEIVSGVLADK